MRTAGLPNFRKLYARIEHNMPKGWYIMTIENNYNVIEFEGAKYFILSTSNILGGQNYFLALCYLIIGILCAIFAIIYGVKMQMNPK